MLQNKQILYIFLIILQGLIFGIGNPITTIAYESVTPFWCMAIRFVIAAGILLLIAGKSTWQELKNTRAVNWLPASISMALAYITSNLALKYTDVTIVGFLMSLSVIFTPLLALFILRRRYSIAVLPAQLLAIVGLYLLCSSGGGFHFGWGEFLAILCSLFMAGSLVWAEDGLAYMSPLTITVTQLVITAILAVSGALLFEPTVVFSAITPAAWWVILYLAILSSIVSYFLQNAALEHISSGIVALTQCFEPVFTAAAAFLILGEELTFVGWGGAALILLCIIYGNYVEMKVLALAALGKANAPPL